MSLLAQSPDKTRRLNYSMMAPLLWNYFKYYNCNWVSLGLLKEKEWGPVGSDQHQSMVSGYHKHTEIFP